MWFNKFKSKRANENIKIFKIRNKEDKRKKKERKKKEKRNKKLTQTIIS